MTAVVLHLSDIHIKTANDSILKRGTAIAAATYSSLPAASHVFIVCSGDVAYSGKCDQYKAASNLFSEIKLAIGKERACPVSFIFAPGNHDCNFDKNNGARNMLVGSMERSDSSEVDDSVIESCTSIQSEYFEFRDALEEGSAVADDKLWRTSVFKVEGKKIVFDSLNISWVSKVREDVGKLFFPIERYADRSLEQADVRLLVMHHPLNWFNQSIYRTFRTFVRKISNIVITGHEHLGTVGVIEDAETESSAYIEGCVLQGDSDTLGDSSFNVAVIDLAQGKFGSTRYEWDGDMYAVAEEGSWFDYRDLPSKRNNPFTLQSHFQETLDDPGAFFKHPARTNIGLSDIYVYPDLRKLGDGEDRRRAFLSSRHLLAPESTADGVLIEGEEKTGCTSLLYQLYRQYHERGFVPLYIKGRDLKRITDADTEKMIRRAVEHQYGSDRVEAFIQLPRDKKLLLLDDFDESPMQASDARAELLGALRKRFNHLVVTVGDMFEMREMLDSDATRALSSLAHYKVQPFGHALRGELISRWLTLGADGTIDASETIARLHQAEKLVNTVMQKSVIPANPLYLLILLQRMDAGRSGDFNESALGYYYQYLLAEALQSSGVKPNKLTEHFQYAAYLAWEFHQQGKCELSESELRAFNEHFSKTWHTVDFKPRLGVLLNARVLCKSGEDYAFRYPYIYFYLKGQFLSENLSDLTVRSYIGHCCEHLYVREHANTVLFLAHHSNDDFVLNSISDTLHNLFRDKDPVRFDGDTISINKLIQDAPQLTYSGEKPEEHRVRKNKLQDDLDDGQDGLAESEEESEELSLIAQMTILFKTTEILGQVLKNQYSKIQRARKGDVLEDLFNGPLRAMQNFYSFFEKYPDALVIEIEATLQRKSRIQNPDERNIIARKVAAEIIQVLTLDFLVRASESANSSSLQEDVKEVVHRAGTPAFKLIELGIALDSPRPIPRNMLKNLFNEVKNDLVARRVIQMMVVKRLYMFKTTERDMQWISQALDIDLGHQHAITYQDNQRRLNT